MVTTDSFSVYLIVWTTIEKTDENTGCALLYYEGHDDNVEVVEFSERNPDGKVAMVGFGAGDLEVTGEAIAAGKRSADGVVPMRAEGSAREINNTLVLTGNVNRGLIGAIVVNADNKVLGILTEADGVQGVAAKSSDILTYLWGNSITPPTEAVTEAQTESAAADGMEELRERLSGAIEKAKNLDVTGYTEDSVRAFEEAIANAEQVLGSATATPDDIVAAGNALKEAKSGLHIPEVADVPNPLANPVVLVAAGFGALLVIALIFFLIRLMFGGKKKQDGDGEKAKKAKPAKGKKKDSQQGAYGGEKSRESRNAANDDDGESDTSLLSSSGESETTLLGGLSVKAFLTPSDGSEEVKINKQDFIVGKAKKKVDYCIPDNDTISRTHAAFHIEDGEVYIEDLDSLNKTFVNGIRLDPHKSVRLSDGDKVKMSNVEFTFRVEDD